MHSYLSQFGDITRLRLSRNKKTGRSKHYAYVEFASTEVAKIVAATMNKYLLFGHILQVRLMNRDEVPKDLFKGANTRFRAIPRQKMQGRRLRLPMEREDWDKKIAAENQRRKAKEEKLMALGYEFKAPILKGTNAIPIRKQVKPSDTESKSGTGVPQTLVDTAPVIEITETVKADPSVVEVSTKVTTKAKAKGGKPRLKGTQ